MASLEASILDVLAHIHLRAFNLIAHLLGSSTLSLIPVSQADTLSIGTRIQWEYEQEDLKKNIVLQDSEQVKILADNTLLEDKGMHEEFYIAGVDISFIKGDSVNACAALVVTSYPSLKLVYCQCQMIKLTAPYIPGFLGFREVPFIVELFNNLKQSHSAYLPQVIMVDGNGILHPREFGSACHLGVILNIPCIGVAKKLFHVDGLQKDAEHQKQIENLHNGGDSFVLKGKSGRIFGMALRSCNSSTNPIYVSPGHLVTVETATKLVYRCCKHRMPEPIRWADIKSRAYLREHFQQRSEKKVQSSNRRATQKRNEIMKIFINICRFLLKTFFLCTGIY